MKLEKLPHYLFGGLTILCVIAVVTGAYWHIGTAAICYLMSEVPDMEDASHKSGNESREAYIPRQSL